MIQAVFSVIAAVGGFLTCGWFAVREAMQGNWLIAAVYIVLGSWLLRKQLRLDELDSKDDGG